MVYTASVSSAIQQIDAAQLDKVTDTTAAGDSFNAAYPAARFSGQDPVTTAKYGHQLAGTVLQHPVRSLQNT